MQNLFLWQIIACKWALNCKSGFFGWWNTNRKIIILLRHPKKLKQIQSPYLSWAYLQHNFVNINTTLWTIKHSFGFYVYECLILSIIQQLQNIITHAKCIFVAKNACKWALNCKTDFFGWWNTNTKNIILLRHPMKSKQI